MKKINLSLALVLLCATSSFLFASQRNSPASPLRIQRLSQQPSPREPEAHISTVAPSYFDHLQTNTQNDQVNQPDCHKRAKHLQHFLRYAHTSGQTLQALILGPEERPNQRWLEGLVATTLSCATAGTGYITHQQITKLVDQHQQKRLYIPGMETVATGAGQWCMAGASSIITLSFFTLAIYKINRLLHAECRYKQERQDKNFADTVNDLAEKLSDYQIATNTRFKQITERDNSTKLAHRTLAQETQNELQQQSKQINLLRAALTSNFSILRNFASYMQANGNHGAKPQIPNILAQAEQAHNQLQQNHHPEPRISIPPTEEPLAAPSSTPIRPKTKHDSCCDCQ